MPSSAPDAPFLQRGTGLGILGVQEAQPRTDRINT